MFTNIYQIIMILQHREKTDKSNDKAYPWGAVVVNSFILLIISLYVEVARANSSEELSKKEWYNPSTVIPADLFRATSVAYADLIKIKNLEIKNYFIISGHGGKGIFVVFNPILSAKNNVLNEKHVDVYWIDDKMFTIKQNPKYTWANTEVVIQGNLFRAAYVAAQDFMARFKHEKIENQTVIVGHGGDGIMVRFELKLSDNTPAVFGGRDIDFWIDEKTYAVKRVNYLK